MSRGSVYYIPSALTSAMATRWYWSTRALLVVASFACCTGHGKLIKTFSNGPGALSSEVGNPEWKPLKEVEEEVTEGAWCWQWVYVWEIKDLAIWYP